MQTSSPLTWRRPTVDGVVRECAALTERSKGFYRRAVRTISVLFSTLLFIRGCVAFTNLTTEVGLKVLESVSYLFTCFRATLYSSSMTRTVDLDRYP
jgi:hypothetical protein